MTYTNKERQFDLSIKLAESGHYCMFLAEQLRAMSVHGHSFGHQPLAERLKPVHDKIEMCRKIVDEIIVELSLEPSTPKKVKR